MSDWCEGAFIAGKGNLLRCFKVWSFVSFHRRSSLRKIIPMAFRQNSYLKLGRFILKFWLCSLFDRSHWGNYLATLLLGFEWLSGIKERRTKISWRLIVVFTISCSYEFIYQIVVRINWSEAFHVYGTDCSTKQARKAAAKDSGVSRWGAKNICCVCVKQ